MKIKIGVIFFSLYFFLPTLYSSQNLSDVKLWYNQPATVWEEALPLGNGRIGAMVFGNPLDELYQLNEETLWSGPPEDGNNPEAKAALPLMRQAIDEGDYTKAAKLWKTYAQGPYSTRYLPMGNLRISISESGEASNVYRELNLSNALSIVSYTLNGVNYKRTSFISYPDQVMVVKFEADRQRNISFNLTLHSPLKYSIKVTGEDYIVMKGKCPDYVAHRTHEPEQIVYKENGEGIKFETHVKIIPKGGTLSSKDGVLNVQNADEVVIIMSAATSFNGFDKLPVSQGKNPSLQATLDLKAAVKKGYQNLYNDHIQDYRELFNRVYFTLGNDNESKKNIPTDKRLRDFMTDDTDLGLIDLYYQYGRYLTIASSREGGYPSNLQGIWNKDVQPAWGSNFTTNINTEMNYWLTETTNLPECHIPLLDFIGSLAVNGKKTALINYGIDKGWVAHHNADIWAKTSPTGNYDKDPVSMVRWNCWAMSGAWFSQHLWEHYVFGGNREYLENKAYPLMKDAAEFMLEWLQLDENTGYWITNPSSSPENSFKYTDKNGKEQEGEIAKASTMDMAMIWDLFSNCIHASRVLDIDSDFRERLEKIRLKLYPYNIGSKGQLQEWHADFEDIEPDHRHASHLFGLHPGRQIQPQFTPELAEAAKKSLLMRGDEGTGWAMAWKVNFWARLEDGNHAYQILKNGLKYIDPTSEKKGGGGTYPNLFDAHPPFQIDGNFGGTAGITEMLLQSHGDDIFLLPALPDNWKEGKIKGIRARGGFNIDIAWSNGKLTKVVIHSTLGGNCRLRSHKPLHSDQVNIRDASGKNPNPYYFSVESRPYMKNNNKTNKFVVSETYKIDFETKAGDMFIFYPQ